MSFYPCISIRGFCKSRPTSWLSSMNVYLKCIENSFDNLRFLEGSSIYRSLWRFSDGRNKGYSDSILKKCTINDLKLTEIKNSQSSSSLHHSIACKVSPSGDVEGVENYTIYASIPITISSNGEAAFCSDISVNNQIKDSNGNYR